MDDTAICECCISLTENEYPHESLQLISRMPESSIYRCKSCKTFWMCSIEDGWENLDFNGVWDQGNKVS